MRCFLVLTRPSSSLMLYCTALARRCNLLGDDPGDPPSCQPGRMPAIAACNNDHNVIGTAHHRHQGLGIILVNPGRPVAIAVMCDAFEPAHRHARLLKDVCPYVGFREASSRHLSGMLWTEYQGELCACADLIVIGAANHFNGLD